MKWKNPPQYQIPLYVFENLEESRLVRHGFTTRLYQKNGEQNNFFQPLLRKDSDPSEVEACIQLLLSQFETDADHLVPSAQEHTANIHVVSEEDLGPEEQRTPLHAVDGLVTDRPGVLLQTFGADCPSIYLLDPVHKAIGLCHSGRKGTQQHIAAVMLQVMEREYGTNPEQVLAAISPGICRECYEVGDDVAAEFLQEYAEGLAGLRGTANVAAGVGSGAAESVGASADIDAGSAAGADVAANAGAGVAANVGSVTEHIAARINGRYHLDLFRAIAGSLEAAGVPSGNIEISDLCTKCRSDRFFSFRAEGKISNENCALLMLR